MTVQDMKDRHFLVVDDEDFSRTSVGRVLKKLGAEQISYATDGTSAVKCLLSGEAPVDCVITDLNMEPVNGLELLKVVRVGYGEIDRTLRFIMITSLNDLYLAGTAMRLDASGFLAKPVSLDKLQPVVDLAFEEVPELGPPESYAAVVTPDCSRLLDALDSDDGDLRVLSRSTGSADRKSIRFIDMSDLDARQTKLIPLIPSQAGHILSEDVLSDDGQTLLEAKTILTPGMIRGLAAFFDSTTKLGGRLKVYCDRAPGH